MKKLLSVTFSLLICMFLLASCGADNDDGIRQESTATAEENIQQPENDTSVFGVFITKDMDGNEVTQQIFAENKLTMVNIWATFCGPCINEMPALGELAEEYKNKGVAIVGIPVDITDDNGVIYDKLYNKATQIIAETNADYVHIVPSAVMCERKLASVYSVPETIFVDSQGNQVGQVYMGARSKEQWAAIIDGLLGEMQ